MKSGQRDFWNDEEDEEKALQREQDELLDVVQEVVERLGIKEVAHALGLDRRTVGNAVYQRDRQSPPMTWLPRLLALDPERRLLRYLADRQGFAVQEQERRSPEQIVAETRAYLQRMGEPGLLILNALRLK